MEVIRYANKMSSEAHKEVMKNIKPGMHEFQLERYFKQFKISKNINQYYNQLFKAYSLTIVIDVAECVIQATHAYAQVDITRAFSIMATRPSPITRK